MIPHLLHFEISSMLDGIKTDEEILYRIEDQTSFGPYCHSGWKDGFHHKNNGRPAIHEEKEVLDLLKNNPGIHIERFDIFHIMSEGKAESFHKEFKFAFRSLDQLYSWFTKEELIRLAKKNYMVASYRVKRSWKFEKQSVFNEADIIEQISMSHI